MTSVRITGYPDGYFEELDYGIVELAEFKEGDVVEIGDELGVVTSLMTENFEFPTGEGLKKIEASSDEPAYVVAMANARGSRMRVVTEDELEEGEMPDTGISPEKAAKQLANEGEMAEAYDRVDDPYSLEELINIPGVDDPEVGWDDWPPTWKKSEKPARLIFLDMWSSVGGTFTSCRAEFAGRIPRVSKFCAASKDEALGTERWRNRF